MGNFFTKHLKQVFTLDLRALALMRIGLSLVLLTDLFLRVFDLKEYYTDAGVLPLEALFRFLWNPHYFSFYTISGSGYIITFLFLVNALCLFCLLLGYRTRLFTLLSWILLLSLHNRNPLILQGGDDFVRMILFWAIFLPWGYRYSIDAYKSQQVNNDNRFESVACVAYIAQVAFLYYFSALLKSSPEWTTDFTAIYYALSLDQMVTPIGKFIYPHYDLLKALTAIVYHIEFILPFFLFIPFFNAWFRMVFIVIIGGMHLNIYLTLNVGLFSAISTITLLGLIPTHFMDKAAAAFPIFINKIKLQANKLVARAFRFSTSAPMPSLKTSLFSEVFVLGILTYVLLFNMSTIGKAKLPNSVQWAGHLLRLNQRWGMFAPSVYKFDGWFILSGTTADGEKIDLLRKGERVTYDKPGVVTDIVRSDRWRKYSENILLVRNSHFRAYYCNYLLKHWNQKHKNNHINSLEIIYMKEISLPDYKLSTPEKEVICTCADPEKEAKD